MKWTCGGILWKLAGIILTVYVVFWLREGLSRNDVRVNFELFNRLIESHFGPGRLCIAHEWEQMLISAAGLSENAKIKAVHSFFTRKLRYETDSRLWGVSDYWATPLETLGRGAGDCEDWAIAMYFSLRSIGVPDQRLRLIYAVIRRSSIWGRSVQPHMVLGYYPSSRSEPLILGNVVPWILPASRRYDLTPVFSFNSAGLFEGLSRSKALSGPLSKWRSVLCKARSEGFML